MKFKNLIFLVLVAVIAFSASSCEDFLNRPTEDNYNESNFYQNDEQCIQGVNYLYNSPWYDFQRGYLRVGEMMSGNVYSSTSPYVDLSVNGTDEDLVRMSYSLWAVIGHSNVVYNRLKTAVASLEVKNQCMGECLTMKAMAYFYLVRSFGAVPIVHDNSADLAGGNYNEKYKVEKADVYEYIVMTLEKAISLLPERGELGRIDKYSAEGLLAKVYLTRSGVSGTRSEADLEKAAQYAGDVIERSGRNLLPVYSDNFRLENNKNEEALISWHWNASREPWTQQNSIQSNVAMVGFDEFGDCWGGYVGPSVDLQDAFGVSALQDPAVRTNVDTRRKATMMLPGDVYEYFWQDKGGFDYLRFMYDPVYGKGGPGKVQSGSGSNYVKHLYGNANDHIKGLGVSAGSQYNGLATHILRLSDVYLIYAEAKMGTASSTSDASALAAFNAVRSRAIPSAVPKTVITWDDIWKERRLELATEGDRWYDYVRLAYYDLQKAIDDLKGQRRAGYYNLDKLYKSYYESGAWVVPESTVYNPDPKVLNVTKESFTLPFPNEDVVFNPHLLEDPVHVDVRKEFSY